MAVDPKWEFDCPQYVDFNEPLHCDESIDSFFDCQLEVPANLRNVLPIINSDNESLCINASTVKKEKLTLDKKGKNACLQSMGAALSKLYPLRLTPSRLAREATKSPKNKRKRLSDKMIKELNNLNIKNSVKQEYSINCSAQKSPPPSSMSLNTKQRSFTSSKGSITRFKVTKRKTTAKSSRKFIKSSEEIEMDKIKELRKQLVAHRTLSEQSKKKALLNHTNMSQNSSSVSHTQHTIVKPFKFATDSRIKGNEEIETRQEKDFVSSLRNNPPQQYSLDRVTKPIPFKLSKNRKRKFEDMREPYCPLAEQIEAFQHGKPFAAVNNMNMKDFQCKLTRPQTPNLRSVARSRPVTALSQEEKENLLVQEMKSYQFKANAINAGVMKQPRAIKPVKRRITTRPEDVHLETERRYVLRERNCSKQDEVKFEFHANPAPKRILEQIVGLKQKMEIPLTYPQSPAFALKQRVQTWKDKNAAQKSIETIVPVFKARPLPHTGIQFWPKFQKKSTMVEPFSFQEQDNIRKACKEKKIQEEIAKQSKRPEFKATPILMPSKTDIPIIPKMSLIQVRPFTLLADERGSEKAEKWKKTIEEEFRRQKEATVFRAGPNKAIYDKPFVPTGSLKPLSDIASIKLHTEERAGERKKFESQRLMRQKELEEEYERQQKEQKLKEDAEIARLRAETVHKATSVKHYKSKPIQRSNVELTQPQSPFLYTRLRSKKGHNIEVTGTNFY